MNANPWLSKLRHLLHQPPSSDLWQALRALLDQLPNEHRTLVQSYAAQHLIHWPLALRQAQPFERFSHPPSWWPLVRLVRFHPPRPQTWLFQTDGLDHIEALDLKGCREGIFDLVRDARVWTGRPKALSLSWTDLQNRGAQALAQLNWLCHLHRLDLQRNSLTAQAPLAELLQMVRLTWLDLSQNAIGFEGAQALATTPHLAQLHTLSLAANTRHADVGRSMLAALCHPQATTTELRAFDFSNNPTPRAAIASLAQLPHLTHLDLHGCGLDDEAAVQLLTTSPAPLQWLNLAIGHHHDTAPLSDATLLALAQTPHADRLQALNLSGSSLSAQGFELLASAFPQLRVVVLRQVLLSNDGAAALASAPHLQQLQRLDLEGSRISPDGLTLLQRSSQLPALRHLNLAANPEVADVDGHEALLQSSLGQRLETLGFPNAYLRAAVRRRLGDAFPRELSVEWGRPDQYSLMTRRRFEGETVYDPLWATV